VVPTVRLSGVLRDTVTRRLAHVPFGWRPTTLLLRVRRYKCSGCERIWRQPAHRAPTIPPELGVRQRCSHPGRSDLGHLRTDRGRLPRPRPQSCPKTELTAVIDAITRGVPPALVELRSAEP
jgi:zinc-finger of transposase IS204/IS1001/IS1096/IS1165